MHFAHNKNYLGNIVKARNTKKCASRYKEFGKFWATLGIPGAKRVLRKGSHSFVAGLYFIMMTLAINGSVLVDGRTGDGDVLKRHTPVT